MRKLKNLPLSSYLTFFSAGSFSFFNVMQFSAFNSIASSFMQQLHITPNALGLLSSSYLWANAIGLIVIGIWLDRISSRSMVLSLAAANIISCYGLGLSHVYLLSFILRFLQGLASAASMLLSTRMAMKLFHEKAHLMIGIIIAMAALGGIVGNNVVAYELHQLGFDDTLFAMSGFGVLIFLLMVIGFHPPYQPNKITEKISFAQFKTVIHKQTVAAGFCLGLINAPVFVLATLWGNLFLVKSQNISQLHAANFSSLIFIGCLVGSPFWGTIAQYVSSVLKLTSIAIIVTLIFLIDMCLVHDVKFIMLSVFMFNLGFLSSSQNLIYPVITKNNPSFLLSTITGIVCFLANSIGAISQWLFGVVMALPTHLTEGGLLFISIEFIVALFLLQYI